MGNMADKASPGLLDPKYMAAPGNFDTKVIRPYTHDCDSCLWCGWYSRSVHELSNVYFCPHPDIIDADVPKLGSIIIRHSDLGPDYSALPVFLRSTPNPVIVPNEFRDHRLAAKQALARELERQSLAGELASDGHGKLSVNVDHLVLALEASQLLVR